MTWHGDILRLTMFFFCSYKCPLFSAQRTNDPVIEQAIETQRLRLLRIIAGLLTLVAVASMGPVSRMFPLHVRSFVWSILSRAELAAANLVIAQAGVFATLSRNEVDRARLFHCAAIRNAHAPERDVIPALTILRRRLRILRNILEHLPHHGMRLLRRAARHRKARIRQPRADYALSRVPTLDDMRLVLDRVERPPD